MSLIAENTKMPIILYNVPSRTGVNIDAITCFELSKIHIPYDWNLASTNPSVDKISQRINEYYQSGRFKSVVLCHPDGTLRDGYTAYLVAKMFGHDTLRAFCVATENISAGQGG